jgi:hypothetical protein
MSYEFGLEMAWKSAAISGAAFSWWRCCARARPPTAARCCASACYSCCRFRDRLAVPGAGRRDRRARRRPHAAPAAQSAAAPALLGEAEPRSSETMAALSATEATGDWNDPGILFLLLYLGGVAMVGGRLLAGLLTLRRWTREAREVVDPVWTGALARAETGDTMSACSFRTRPTRR